jgi:hypothetical protein
MPFLTAVDQIMRLGHLAGHHPVFAEAAKSIDALVDTAVDLEETYSELTGGRSLSRDVQGDLEAARLIA